MSTNEIYKAPKSEVENKLDKPAASKSLKATAVVLTIASVLELAPVGMSHDVGTFYTVGHALSGIIFSGFFVGIFQISKCFRTPSPRLALYAVMLVIYMAVYFPQLMAVINA